MKKGILLTEVFLMILFAFVSCGKAPASDPGAAGRLPTPKPYSPGMMYADVYTTETDFDNRFGRTFVSLIETEETYFFHPTHSGYEYFCDKLSGESGVLCGKPECVHDKTADNAECGGFTNGIAANTVNLYQGKLYYLGDAPPDELGNRTAVYRMNTDGTEHERLFRLRCDAAYIPQRLDCHRGRLYGWNCTETVTDGVPEQLWSVSCFDIETGDFKLICEGRGYSTVMPTLFYFGKYVYICASWGLHSETGGNADAQEWIGTNIRIYRWDIDKAELETVADGVVDSMIGLMPAIWVEAEDRIYIVPKVALTLDGERPETAVYMIRDGGIEKLFDFDGRSGNLDALDGGVILYDFDREKEMMPVCIKDFTGAIVYEGKWDMRLLRSLAPGASFCSFYAVMGDTQTLYCSMLLNANGKRGGANCLIRCRLMDGEPEMTVLFVTENS
ncbi:MAG: hypothetical protein IJM20_04875 [Clostridia bacterium]|nr:hypothetical protein [Clostridia bacterium]